MTSVPENFAENLDIKSVIIPNSVTSIGESAFSDCSSLTSINIPNSVTSIGESAFLGCSKLTSITIPGSVTSIGYCAFYNCIGLTSITILRGVTSIGESAFDGCTNLTSVTIPSSVTSIGSYAFSNCSSMQRIFIPRNVTVIENYSFNMWMKSAVIYCEVDSKPNGWGDYWNKYEQFTVTVVWGSSGTPLIEFGWEYIENSSGTITILAYRGSEKELATPKTLANKTVSRINGYCFSDNKSITLAIISDGVEYI